MKPSTGCGSVEDPGHLHLAGLQLASRSRRWARAASGRSAWSEGRGVGRASARWTSRVDRWPLAATGRRCGPLGRVAGGENAARLGGWTGGRTRAGGRARRRVVVRARRRAGSRWVSAGSPEMVAVIVGRRSSTARRRGGTGPGCRRAAAAAGAAGRRRPASSFATSSTIPGATLGTSAGSPETAGRLSSSRTIVDTEPSWATATPCSAPGTLMSSTPSSSTSDGLAAVGQLDVVAGAGALRRPAGPPCVARAGHVDRPLEGLGPVRALAADRGRRRPRARSRRRRSRPSRSAGAETGTSDAGAKSGTTSSPDSRGAPATTSSAWPVPTWTTMPWSGPNRVTPWSWPTSTEREPLWSMCRSSSVTKLPLRGGPAQLGEHALLVHRPDLAGAVDAPRR